MLVVALFLWGCGKTEKSVSPKSTESLELSEQEVCDVILIGYEGQGSAIYKALQSIESGNNQIGLQEAIDLVRSARDGTPVAVLKGVSKGKAEMAKQKLEAAGAQVSLKTAGIKPAEGSSFDVILVSHGATSNKIAVLQVIRKNFVRDGSLRKALDIMNAAPKAILEGVSKDEAEEAKQKLEAAGAKIEIK